MSRESGRHCQIHLTNGPMRCIMRYLTRHIVWLTKDISMKDNNIELEMVADNGRPMREFSHEGKIFVESREGSKYALRVKNNTSNRVLVVASIDSLNAITGKPAKNGPNEAGYIVNAYDSYLIRGFRVSDDEVAAFQFVKKGKSYATSVGSGGGNGVVAVRVYEEKRKPITVVKTIYVDRPYPVWPNQPFMPRPANPWYSTTDTLGWATTDNQSISYTCSTAQKAAPDGREQCRGTLKSLNFMSQVAPQQDAFDSGTSFGAATEDKVTHVSFEVGALLTELVIYYSSKRGLESMGIKLTKDRQVAFPEPFKREYAVPPAGWPRD